MHRYEQPTVALPKPTASSRVTNGGSWLPFVDGRTRVARRVRDLALRYEAQLGYSPNEAHRSLCKLAAIYCAAAEEMAASLVCGKPVDREQLLRIGNSLCSTLKLLGINADT